MFMTLNLLRDDPEYMIGHYILPMKLRFIEDQIRPPYLASQFAKFKFSTFSFGPIKMKNGPESVD